MDGCIDFTFCELREREVINIADGKRLGRVIDMAFACSQSGGHRCARGKKTA